MKTTILCRTLFCAVLLSFAALANSALAQLAGTVWLDFVPDTVPVNYPDTATLGPQTSFADALRGLNGLTTLTNAQVTTIENDIVSIVQAKYNGMSINITSNAGDPAAANPSAPPGGDYSLVVLGDAGGANANVLGQASQLDWRNLSFNDQIGLSVSAFDGFTNPPGTVYTSTTVARALANTISHEIGHVLGLVHTDAAATYAATAGTDAQKKTAVQNTDLMRANVTSFNSAVITTTAFNSYSQIKLDVAAHGILLENQAQQTALGHPNTADPISETADTNINFANALPLISSNGRVNVIGQMTNDNVAKIDFFKFDGVVGQTVSFEVYSLGLEQIENDTDSGRIPTGQSIGDNTLILVNSLNNEIIRSMFPTTAGGATNYDGATDMNGDPIPNDYGDALIYNITLPATDTYYLQLEGSQNGFYELFAVVPEPSSLVLAAVGLASLAITLGRRRTRLAV